MVGNRAYIPTRAEQVGSYIFEEYKGPSYSTIVINGQIYDGEMTFDQLVQNEKYNRWVAANLRHAL